MRCYSIRKEFAQELVAMISMLSPIITVNPNGIFSSVICNSPERIFSLIAMISTISIVCPDVMVTDSIAVV